MTAQIIIQCWRFNDLVYIVLDSLKILKFNAAKAAHAFISK
jgi:hypothetical protein